MLCGGSSGVLSFGRVRAGCTAAAGNPQDPAVEAQAADTGLDARGIHRESRLREETNEHGRFILLFGSAY